MALVDALDMFDVASGVAAGIDLSRLLWIRGHVVSNPGMCRDMNQRAMEQSIKALTLVLQAGNFGVVAWDVGEAPADAIRRLPFTTWLRLQRMVEGSHTVCLLLGSDAMARSAAGLTLRLGPTAGVTAGVTAASPGLGRQEPGMGRPHAARLARGHVEEPVSAVGSIKTGARPARPAHRFTGPLFQGLDVAVRVVRARVRMQEEAAATLTAAVSPDA